MTEVVFEELGFPVVLVNPSMVSVRGVLVPDVNLRALQKEVFQRLINKLTYLTGDEFTFARKFMRLGTLKTAFLLDAESDSIVKQWSAQGFKYTGMDQGHERKFRSLMAKKAGHPLQVSSFSQMIFEEWMRINTPPAKKTGKMETPPSCVECNARGTLVEQETGLPRNDLP